MPQARQSLMVDLENLSQLRYFAIVDEVLDFLKHLNPHENVTLLFDEPTSRNGSSIKCFNKSIILIGPFRGIAT
jgi:hypothetical protein